MGIIGVLAAIGLPLYKSNQDSAVEAVIKNNAFSIQKTVDNLVALDTTVTTAVLGNKMKVKGKALPAACFNIKSNNSPVTEIKSGNAWRIHIQRVTTTCEQLEAKFNTCIDSTGKITKDVSSTNTACAGTPDLNS